MDKPSEKVSKDDAFRQTTNNDLSNYIDECKNEECGDVSNFASLLDKTIMLLTF